MAIESKNLLTVLKANARAKKLPLDYTEVWESLAEAEAYLSNPTAYAGQTIKALKEDGEYHTYTLQPEGENLVLKEVGAVTIDDIKQCVVVTTALPTTGVENTLYINTTDSTGYIWDGTKFVEAFANVQVKIDALREELMEEINKKAPIESPTFTGTVTLAADPTTDLEAVTKRYVDSLITRLENNTTPGIVNSTSPLPATDYQAGMTFRVSEAGTYAGVKCEVGDLIIVLKDYVADTASDADFMVVQANIDGAVTGPESATNLNIAIFDGATGKVIKDSEVGIASLQDAIAKAHEHANKEVLDTFDKTQTEILEEITTQVNTAKETLTTEIDKKANKGTTLADYGITDAYTQAEVDNKLNVINTNLNTKLDQTAVQALVDAGKEEAIKTAGENAATALDEKVGEIGEVTVKEYVDTQAAATGTATDEKIATAKTEAITAAGEAADQKIADKVGDLGESATVKEYVDAHDAAVTTDLEQKIATAKSEAIETAGTNADNKIAAKVGDLGESETVVNYVDAAIDEANSVIVF